MSGVARCLLAHKLHKGVKYAGCSAGALAAVGILFEGDFDYALQLCKDKYIPQAYAKPTGIFSLAEFASDCIDKTCNLYKWRQLQPGQLQVAITNLPFFHAERAKIFVSEEDLKKCLLASSSAWPFAPLVYRNGVWCVDGGLSDFQPIVDEDTITVSPFYFSDADIKPSRYVPLWWAFLPPQSKDTIDWLYALGYEDCVKYLEKTVPGFVSRDGIKRNPHSYDIRSSDKSAVGSINRFLGYDTNELTSSFGLKFLGYFMDFIMLILLIIVWKPLALACIYFEISLWVCFHFLTTVSYEMYELYPIISLAMGFFAPDLALVSSLSFLVFLQKVSLFGYSKNNKIDKIFECLSCLWSVSLILRFLTGGPSSATLRKHDKLAKNSIIYRIFRHMI